MKTLAISSLLLPRIAICSAQELETIAECRAYREAWQTSVEDDAKRLPVKELIHRADQMMVCDKEIDAKPFQAGMTHDEATKVAIAALGYPRLASIYYQEAFNRAARFIDNKHLTHEFIATDPRGAIQKPKHE